MLSSLMIDQGKSPCARPPLEYDRAMPTFEALVERLAAEARADPAAWAQNGWARAAGAVAGRAAAFLEWARDHRRWRGVVAEAADEVCAKPPEAAAFVLHGIIAELLEDDEA
jgi:hypothetical protein